VVDVDVEPDGHGGELYTFDTDRRAGVLSGSTAPASPRETLDAAIARWLDGCLTTLRTPPDKPARRPLLEASAPTNTMHVPSHVPSVETRAAMTMTLNRLITAIGANNHDDLWKQFGQMTLAEMVAAGTACGPARLRELMRRYVNVPQPFAQVAFFMPQTPPGAQLAKQVIPEILAQAFKDRSFLPLGPVRSAPSAKLAADVGAELSKVSALRKSAQQITIYRDVTGTLPPQTTSPPTLSDADYQAVADRNGVSLAAIKAVAKVESGGSGFDKSGRPKILFEAHHFSKHTKHVYDLSHPHLSTQNRQEAKKFYKWDQYNRLYEALMLDPDAACKSASWGKFQVLGSNHNGWPDAISFARAMCQSEANHLKCFEAYCISANLIRHLKTKNWAAFAEGYNGKNYAEYQYDTKIEGAYKAYGGT
jgi:hypothetical protein